MTEGTHPRAPESDPRTGPTEEQVNSRAETLEAEPGNQSAAPERQARSLLEESEERIEDPAARTPGDGRVIRRGSDEGVGPEQGAGRGAEPPD